MTQMVPTVRPTAPLGSRIVASAALSIALAVTLLPERWRMPARIGLVRAASWLPEATVPRVQAMHEAVQAGLPAWWPGQIDCKERSLATVLGTAFTGRRCRWVLGARFLPNEAHAWVEVRGTGIGRDEGDAVDRPWTAVYAVP